MTSNFFSPLSFVAVFGSEIRDPGSGMGKNQDPGSGINIPDPQQCLAEKTNKFFLHCKPYSTDLRRGQANTKDKVFFV
jgi:hypothetical protein